MNENLTPQEQSFLHSLEELETSSLFDVQFDRGPISFPIADFDPLSEIKKEWGGVMLSDAVKGCAPRFAWFSGKWKHRSQKIDFSGEFHMPHLYIALAGDPPEFNDLATEQERILLSQLRLIDRAPDRATGEATFIHVERDKQDLDLWHQDRYLYDASGNTQGLLKMDLDYCGYLEVLRITKGTFGWQLLFMEVSLSDSDLRHHAESIKQMLRIFPNEFPDHDYEPLMERLEERL